MVHLRIPYANCAPAAAGAESAYGVRGVATAGAAVIAHPCTRRVRCGRHGAAACRTMEVADTTGGYSVSRRWWDSGLGDPVLADAIASPGR
jgi:hypothetical protein